MTELTCEDVGCVCGGFWIVLREDGTTGRFLVKHQTEQEAREECERLAKKEQCAFYVLRTIGCAAPVSPPVEWIDLR
jgi:hypothetical protein